METIDLKKLRFSQTVSVNSKNFKIYKVPVSSAVKVVWPAQAAINGMIEDPMKAPETSEKMIKNLLHYCEYLPESGEAIQLSTDLRIDQYLADASEFLDLAIKIVKYNIDFLATGTPESPKK